MRPIELPSTSVFLDFDGTISIADVGRHVLARHAGPAWWELHERYERGDIGSRECLVDQWDLLADVDEHALRATAAEVTVDPGLEPLVEALRGGGAEVVVVSDGFGFYVDDVCGPLGLDVLTNRVDFGRRRLVFPHEDRCCPCSTCGMCKQAPIKEARRHGRSTVLVGDGASDRKAALLADLVFAKDELAGFCAGADVAFEPFTTLTDVRRALVP